MGAVVTDYIIPIGIIIALFFVGWKLWTDARWSKTKMEALEATSVKNYIENQEAYKKRTEDLEEKNKELKENLKAAIKEKDEQRELVQEMDKTINEMEGKIDILEKSAEETKTPESAQTTSTQAWAGGIRNLRAIQDQMSVLTGSDHLINLQEVFRGYDEQVKKTAQILSDAMRYT